jgi:hypothetical protein
MASIRRETVIGCSPSHAWGALRDFGAVHVRLAPGFVTDARLDGPDRIVTFFTGTTLREVLVDVDDDARRLAWSIVDAPYTHHNGVAQVFDAPDGASRLVWVTDLLPNEIAERTAAMMDRGLAVIKETLEGVVAASSS